MIFVRSGRDSLKVSRLPLDETALGTIASRLISETFGALSVSTWLFDEQGERLIRVSSTSDAEQAQSDDSTSSIAAKGSQFSRVN